MRRPQQLVRAVLVAVLLVPLLSSCSEEALPERKLSHDDCLRDVKLDRLDEAIKRCDQVVAAFPRDPLPLNERFLLHSLKNDQAAACRDIARAGELARGLPAASLDRLLRRDLELRSADCRR